MRPYRCTPHPVQAYLWIAAELSTTLSFFSFAVTLSLSRGTTATRENSAPEGFQHLVHPHTWLKDTLPSIDTVTESFVHRHTSVPPAKSFAPALTPRSTLG